MINEKKELIFENGKCIKLINKCILKNILSLNYYSREDLLSDKNIFILLVFIINLAVKNYKKSIS